MPTTVWNFANLLAVCCVAIFCCGESENKNLDSTDCSYIVLAQRRGAKMKVLVT